MRNDDKELDIWAGLDPAIGGELDRLYGGRAPKAPKKAPKRTPKKVFDVVPEPTPEQAGLALGSTCRHKHDFHRLSNARKKVLYVLLDGQPHSNVQLCRPVSDGGGGKEGTRRVRELCSAAWGPLDIQKTRGEKGIWWYQLNSASVTDRILWKVFEDWPEEVEPLVKLRASVLKKIRAANEDTLLHILGVLKVLDED